MSVADQRTESTFVLSRFKKKSYKANTRMCSASLALQYPRWDMLHQEAIDASSLFFPKYQNLDDCHGNTGIAIAIQGRIQREKRQSKLSGWTSHNLEQSTWSHFWLLVWQQVQLPSLRSTFPAQGTTWWAAASSHLVHQPSREPSNSGPVSLKQLTPVIGEKSVPSQPTI